MSTRALSGIRISAIRLAVLVLGLFMAAPVWAAGNLEVAAAARAQIGRTLVYDPAYVQLAYPLGDVPIARGVCTDVVIRALRAVDVDLQQRVHEDMAANFALYPTAWGLSRPDANIDHRRVPNLMTYLTRQGKALPATRAAADYAPGDIVTWRLDNGRPHIGIVSAQADSDSGNPLVIHNIGWGAQEEDMLFDYDITGHYRWFAAEP